MKALETIRTQPAFKELMSLGGEVFLVGGVVRDAFMNKESKDIDVIVRLIPMKKLTKTLEKFGKVELVGESFAVLKFVPKGWQGEPIDVALPRTDTKTGDGHKGFDIQSDHRMTIEEDLIRRDITINSMAMAMDGTLIDPFGGVDDIKARLIKATSTKAFIEDPLRMLRCVQFASRFDFDIEGNTLDMITRNAALVKQEPGERVKTELDKIQEKGLLAQGVFWMNTTGLFEQLFGIEFNIDVTLPHHRMESGEFYTHLFRQFAEPDTIFIQKLKGDTITAKHIKQLTRLERIPKGSLSNNELRVLLAECVRGSSDKLLDYKSTNKLLPTVTDDLKSGMPKRVTELAIGGEELMERGLQGKAIGDTMNRLLKQVLYKELSNEREALLAAI